MISVHSSNDMLIYMVIFVKTKNKYKLHRYIMIIWLYQDKLMREIFVNKVTSVVYIISGMVTEI
jgi:hypothetical protein